MLEPDNTATGLSGVALRREPIMRGAIIIGLLIVSLIVGVLVIKDMGSDSSSGITKSKAKSYVEKAENTASDVSNKLDGYRKQAEGAAAD